MTIRESVEYLWSKWPRRPACVCQGGSEGYSIHWSNFNAVPLCSECRGVYLRA